MKVLTPFLRQLVSVLFAGALTLPAGAQEEETIYADSLENGWASWGWATISLDSPSPVHTGSASISVKINSTSSNWEALYLHHDAVDSSAYTNLTFWINGGPAGGQRLSVQAILGGTAQTGVPIDPLLANTWQKVTMSLLSLGAANQPNLTGFWIMDALGTPQPVFFLDDIALVRHPSPPGTNAVVRVSIDGSKNLHPINPLIYGVAFASQAQLTALNSPLNRSGGNAETRYNWLLNAHNRGSDWYFQSLADESSTPGAEADAFVDNTRNAGAEPMLTIPMLGWAPKLGNGRARLASYSRSKYGPQTGYDSQWFPDAGNGIGTNVVTHTSWLITTNDPNDANLPTNSVFQEAWVKHLTNRWGSSTNGGIRYYLMDNEHTLWHSTHRDVHPMGATMREIRDKIFDYADMVKRLDPGALVFGPEEWGWSGYLYSGFDLQYGSEHGWSYLPDRVENGGQDYMPWLLDQLRQRATITGERLLDYFTLHIYPQGGESGDDVSASMQLRRNRSTRSLWDTNYVDASWINDVVKLIPRMRDWVATSYPGTRIGITEYNWGAENHMNGATAQADILGIFGREGLDLATRWTTPAASTPTFKAMQMFRNYDGKRSGFGETSILADAPQPDAVAAFAALRADDRALTVMVINKQLDAPALLNFNITNFQHCGIAHAWQLTSVNAINRIGDMSFVNGVLEKTVPQQSVTLFVFPAAPRLRPGTVKDGNFEFWLDGHPWESYVIEESTNLRTWNPVQTNTLLTASWQVLVPASHTPGRFYRGVLAR